MNFQCYCPFKRDFKETESGFHRRWKDDKMVAKTRVLRLQWSALKTLRESRESRRIEVASFVHARKLIVGLAGAFVKHTLKSILRHVEKIKGK